MSGKRMKFGGENFELAEEEERKKGRDRFLVEFFFF